MQVPGWAWAAIASFALLTIARVIHTRLRGWLPEDTPTGPRKRHDRPTPLVGFLPAGVCTTVFILAEQHGIATGVALASITGWLDDRDKENGDGIRWWVKAIGLGLAAAATSVDTARVLDVTVTLEQRLAHAALSTVVVFCLSNAANFLDNAHGVALGLCSVGLLLASDGAAGDPATVCAAAWLAVLPFNWPRGSVFLGDSGALPLGLTLGAVVVRSTPTFEGATAVAWFAPTAVLWADFVQVVAARIVLGYRPWVADRRHLTHIALALGVPGVALAPAFALLACAAYALIVTLAR